MCSENCTQSETLISAITLTSRRINSVCRVSLNIKIAVCILSSVESLIQLARRAQNQRFFSPSKLLFLFATSKVVLQQTNKKLKCYCFHLRWMFDAKSAQPQWMVSAINWYFHEWDLGRRCLCEWVCAVWWVSCKTIECVLVHLPQWTKYKGDSNVKNCVRCN